VYTMIYFNILYTYQTRLRTYYIIANIFRRVDLNMVDIGCLRKGSTLCHATRGPGDPVFDMENHQVVARMVVDFPMICGENPSKSGKRIVKEYNFAGQHHVDASSWHPIVFHLNLLDFTASTPNSFWLQFNLWKQSLCSWSPFFSRWRSNMIQHLVKRSDLIFPHGTCFWKSMISSYFITILILFFGKSSIWVNYDDLTATSLELWLIREIIPKWPNNSG